MSDRSPCPISTPSSNKLTEADPDAPAGATQEIPDNRIDGCGYGAVNPAHA